VVLSRLTNLYEELSSRISMLIYEEEMGELGGMETDG
jgi:hypothetical protein